METTLYKRADSGKIQEWTIQVEADGYRTIAGLRGGQKVTSEWTRTETTNVGRSNERSAASQAQFEANAKITKKLEEGYCGSLDDVDKAKKAAWKEPMLAHPIEKKPKALPAAGWSYVVQPKLDGKRCVGVLNDQVMHSRNGKPINTLPFLRGEIISILKGVYDLLDVDDVRLDGELYNHELKDDFNKIISLTSGKKTLTIGDEELIQYHVYDVDIPDLSYTIRHALISEILSSGTYASVHLVNYDVPPSNLKTPEDHMEWIASMQVKYVEMGYEGAMVRIIDRPYEADTRSDSLLKVKSFEESEFTILDVLEGKGNRSNMAGKLIVDIPEKGTTSEAGIAGGVSFYQWLWKHRDSLIGKKATVKYFGFTAEGKLRFPVTKTVDRDDI